MNCDLELSIKWYGDTERVAISTLENGKFNAGVCEIDSYENCSNFYDIPDILTKFIKQHVEETD